MAITNVISWSESDNLPKAAERWNDTVPFHGMITDTVYQNIFLLYAELQDVKNWIGSKFVEGGLHGGVPAVVAKKINIITIPSRTIYKTVRGRSFGLSNKKYNFDSELDLMLGGAREVLG